MANKYKRILLKLSGESLMGDQAYGIDSARLRSYAKEIKAIADQGVQVAIVIGGGNIYRGMQAASLRAIEIEANVILKGTRVDGIYTADPEKDKTATKYERISFDEVYSKGLNVMDLTAFTLCKENDLPIIVFDMNKPGNLGRLVAGEKVGTLVEL